MTLEVISGGLLTSVQDLGRWGRQRYGVVVGGAADPFAARLANLLVGNAGTAALLEITWIGPKLQFEAEGLLAWCGAEFEVRLDGAPLPANRPVRVAAGGIVEFGVARRGARAWLAIAGGIDVPLVLGSRSTSRRFGFGGFQGRALATGDRVPIGSPGPWAKTILSSLKETRRTHCDWSVRPESFGRAASSERLQALKGPEWDWFTRDAQEHFFEDVYRVTKDADRMGLRLSGALLQLVRAREMISSGVNAGVVQVPAEGQPVVLLCSRQTLGGYPRLAAVISVDFARLAQLKPGDLLAFEEVTLEQAHELYTAREMDFRMAAEELSRKSS